MPSIRQKKEGIAYINSYSGELPQSYFSGGLKKLDGDMSVKVYWTRRGLCWKLKKNCLVDAIVQRLAIYALKHRIDKTNENKTSAASFFLLVNEEEVDKMGSKVSCVK